MAKHDDFQDTDALETQEWLEALEGVLQHEGQEKARYLVAQLQAKLGQKGVALPRPETAYVNTISKEQETPLPNHHHQAEALASLLRWNAMAMVLRAGKKTSELGGHIATYASSSLLYETGFNYFFRGATDAFPGDLVYFQGHASPGMYARAFLEGRIDESQLENFRQEVGGNGVSSYPHPWLMEDFWQFPTVSMGLGPLMAIYQARFLKYLENRKLIDNKGRKVWMFCGDGEMDEPESHGALSLPVRESLDNLIIVINCNLQRLDGPVRGNGKIIQELEGNFAGFGWRVIKLIWGSAWDPLLAKDTSGELQQRMMTCLDGDYQSIWAKGGAHIREAFFGVSESLKAMVAHMSDAELEQLSRGGHDPQKVYAAYKEAVNHQGSPVVLLIKTVKGFGMGDEGELKNTTHQTKKLSEQGVAQFAKRFNVPASQKQIEEISFIKPSSNSPEMQFLQSQREQLGGYLPARNSDSPKLDVPSLDVFKAVLDGSGDREISTTMAFVRCLTALLKQPALKDHIVPIVPDESRTFGMEGLFRQIGIYSPEGQKYSPEDEGQLMYYKEARDGQLLEEGINEAGAFASWIAAATSYSTNQLPMIPFYIYYSMFGYQRIGDLAWAAGDMRARGFLLGATAGRTTLAGEGLQHTDGHNLMMYSVVPNCICYDPTFAYEVAVIMQQGLKRMYHNQEDVFYYITLMNENYVQPAMPEGVEEGIQKGIYKLKSVNEKAKKRVTLLGSGTILLEVLKAAELLQESCGIGADIFSVTSFSECQREAIDITRAQTRTTQKIKQKPYVTEVLEQGEGPVVAATDYIRWNGEQIRAYVPRAYTVLGTDGFGRSDTRAQLRHHFEVDAKHIAFYAMRALFDEGSITEATLEKAAKAFAIKPKKANPRTA